MWQVAQGSAPLFCALVALRRTEGGGPGNEFGVLSIPSVDTYPEELATAARSFRNHVTRARAAGVPVYTPDGGDFTEGFLRSFSARWCPVGAENDPRGLNAAHAGNLVALYQQAARQLAQLVTTVA